MELDHNQNDLNNSSSTSKKERIETKKFSFQSSPLNISITRRLNRKKVQGNLKVQPTMSTNTLNILHESFKTKSHEEILHTNFSQNLFNNVSIQSLIPQPTTTKQPPPETHHAKQPSPSPPDDEQHQHSTSLPNRESSIPRNSKLHPKKSCIPESHESIHSFRHELYNSEPTFANDIPTCSPNVALCDLGGDAQPESERSQPHSSTKYNRENDDKQPNTTSVDTTRANPRANHPGILPYPPLSHNPLQPKLAAPQAYTPTELLCQLLVKTNTGYAQSKLGIRGQDVQRRGPRYGGPSGPSDATGSDIVPYEPSCHISNERRGTKHA
ncbi:hypothetical protein KY290_036808 [Solanum tuberosum]|uniref:Uncharacterized protein n=1 Tax=Solanum tuberosum TaxID=4113 RepID=A0ABQ7TUK3_SOLTU|nr:hypothetical protein KY285_036125 [Solanum tuberosum]KAH0738103.1 hypothetical protein KY290_036808 [Solanum tuberosum]